MKENNYYHVDKKSRLEAEQDNMLQQYNKHQEPTEQDPQMQAWTRQQRQFLQSMSSSQRPPLPQPHQQLQLRRRLLQQQIPRNVRTYEASVCSPKLMMFLYHITQRPADNCITFWRKFVAEYFSPRAKQRLCFSQYKGAGNMLGTLPQGIWKCTLCGTKSGKGVEATYDVLARLFETKFASGGIIDELLYLNDPHEYIFSNGMMVLEYRKAVQTTVYEQCRVVREGHLRVTFSQDFKILGWEFCARRHEELLVRRLIAPQVNQLLQVAQKCQSTISESGPEGVSKQDLQTNSNMVLGAGKQLENSMGLESLTHLGYPKKYVRALQTYEVVKSMKDLMDFTYKHKIGPIEGRKWLSEQTATKRLQRQTMQEMMQELENSRAMNRSPQAQMAFNPGNNNYPHQMSGRGAVNGSAPQAAAALTNDQSLLMWLEDINNTYLKTGKLEVFTSESPSPYLSQQWQNLATGSSPQMQHRSMYGTPNTLQQNHPHHLQPPHSQGNYQAQQVLDQMFEEMYGNPSVQQQQAFLGQNGSNSNAERNPTGYTSNISGGVQVPSRNNNNPHFSEDATEVRDGFSEDNFSTDQ
ncbi:unnamed protein product [Eruca vesicaria subsp. sativa]|uniref:Uncharacterized protein n=1 Tax=Eruca vesicaria subsp. sativa TaxID=29727 RepID=A0ABC8LL81_ERUVS|nr:unnamed protein product [Eruca vesicaria subsp. sativa]